MQSDYEGQVGHLDGQRQSLERRSNISAVVQAEQLRALEDKARRWAKKFLYKVKQAAGKAEKEAGVASVEATLSGTLRDATQSRNGRGTLDTIDSLPSPHPSGRSGPSEPPASSPLAQSSFRQQHEGPAPVAVPVHPTRMSLQRAWQSQTAEQPRSPEPVAEAPRWAERAHSDLPQARDQSTLAAAPQPLSAEPSYNQPSEASSYPTPSGVASAPSLHTPMYPSAGAGIQRNSCRQAYAEVGRTYPESAHTSGSTRQAYADSARPESARTANSRGSALLASVNSHLRRPDRRSGGDSEMNSMLDSARSGEFGAAMGDTKGKRRFAQFNRLFNKNGRK